MNTTVSIERWDRGVDVVVGGSRDDEAVPLNRPAQPDMVIRPPDQCIFCTGGPEVLNVVRRYTVDGEVWLLVKNRYTVHPDHHMVIPEVCWTKERLWRLGGPERLATAMRLARPVAIEGRHEQAIFGIQVGPSAGQNIQHPHFHTHSIRFIGCEETGGYPPGYETGKSAEAQIRRLLEDKERWVFEDDRFVAVVGGHFLGQCFLITKDEPMEPTDEADVRLATSICRLVELGNKRFVSLQGRPPDFSISVKYDYGQVVYAMYNPELKPLGIIQRHALLGELPFMAICHAKVTADYLRGK